MVTEDLSAIAEALTLDELSVENADVVFDQQDSGCVSRGVTAVGRRWFVKEATTIKAEQRSRTACDFIRPFATTQSFAPSALSTLGI